MKTVCFAVLLLAACAKPAPIASASCPQVPQCTRPDLPLETNADLVRAYLATDSALAQCKIARDTLAACLNHQPSP
nr:Rz1-like lysis system protein LysC [uncultured Kingella sp.]